MSEQTSVRGSRAATEVLACVVPLRPVLRRLVLGLEDAGALSVRVWLGDDDDGTQLEMIGVPHKAWHPWLVTLGGLDVRSSLVGALTERFSIAVSDAEEVERLMMRSGIVASIAVESSGVEGLHELELHLRDRLVLTEGIAA